MFNYVTNFVLAGFSVSRTRDSHEEEETSHRGRAGAEAPEKGRGCSQESQTSGGREKEATGAETQEKVKHFVLSEFPFLALGDFTHSA